MGERLFSISPTPVFDQWEWVQQASAENAENPTLIEYSVQEIQRLKYRSAGEKREILCVQTLKLIIYTTWDESLLGFFPDSLLGFFSRLA